MSSTQSDQFLSVIQAHKGILYKVANSYCHDAENRKDLIQEIIIQLWLSFGRYDDTFSLSTWIYRVALNVSISFYRKENRRSGINQSLDDATLYLPDTDTGIDTDPDIEQLQRFIKALKEIDRAIMLLYLEEKSQREIAEIMGLSVTNVSTKIARIKQQLKDQFQKQ